MNPPETAEELIAQLTKETESLRIARRLLDKVCKWKAVKGNRKGALLYASSVLREIALFATRNGEGYCLIPSDPEYTPILPAKPDADRTPG